jgi:hypothetical protein
MEQELSQTQVLFTKLEVKLQQTLQENSTFSLQIDQLTSQLLVLGSQAKTITQEEGVNPQDTVLSQRNRIIEKLHERLIILFDENESLAAINNERINDLMNLKEKLDDLEVETCALKSNVEYLEA